MDADRLVLAILAGAMFLAVGCLGPSTPQSDLRVTGIDGDWTDQRDLAFQVTVSNVGEAEGSGTLFVEAEVEDGSTYTDRREVTLAGGASETYTVAFDVPAEEAEGAGGFDVSAKVE